MTTNFRRVITLIFAATCISARLAAVASHDFTLDDPLRCQLTEINDPQFIYGPTTITEAGTYAIKDDIAFDPVYDGESCIVIDADNVILDLNLKTITQAAGNTKVGINGIYIAADVKNVVIRNGSIDALTGIAIRINDGVQLVTMDKLTISNMGLGGVVADGSTGISSIFCNNIIVQGISNADLGGFAVGLYFSRVSSVDIENCSSSNNVAANGSCYGIYFNECSSVRVKSSMANNNLTGGFEVIGVSIANSHAVLLVDCTASHNTNTSSAEVSQVMGFRCDRNTAVTFENCSAMNNESDSAPAYGFFLNDSQHYILQSCHAHANRSFSGSAYGFYAASGDDNFFAKCDASGNKGDTTGFGFFVTGIEQRSTFEDCTIDADLATTGTAYGLYVDYGVSNCFFKHNYIANQIGGTTGFGIYDAQGASTTNRYFGNFLLNNPVAFNFTSMTRAPLFVGPMNGNPGPFENVVF